MRNSCTTSLETSCASSPGATKAPGKVAAAASTSKKTTMTSRRVTRGRALFVGILLALAVALSTAAYFILHNAEWNLAATEFYSNSERAMDKAREITLRKRLGTITMATIAQNINPDAAAWPFVTIRGYEETTQNLIATSSGREMGFCPLVLPEQLTAFEDFAYNYYYHDRQPEPFPNTTAQSEEFGRGVWGMTVDSEGNKMRYHEVDGTTSWNSTRQILAPILHHNEGPFPALMLNLHFQEARGVVIDSMMDCAEERLESIKANASSANTVECGAITDMLELTSQAEGTGPGALIMQPIYASNQELVGLIASSIVWDETLVDVFASAVSGIDCVLKTSVGSTYTYAINRGVATIKGEGDLHDRDYDDFELSIVLTPDGFFSNSSARYELFLYPNDEFFGVYSTQNPVIATIGAVAIVLLTSLFFFLYDTCVRKDISTKQELLQAKRSFMRMVSHEVRTPLNAVCMGLTMMEEELKMLFYHGVSVESSGNERSIISSQDYQCGPSPKCLSDVCIESQALEERVATTASANINNTNNAFTVRRDIISDWLSLTQDVLLSAQASVDVLSDFLNFDKVENGSLELDLTKVDIWDLIARTVNEFRISAVAKKIDLTCSFLTADDNLDGSTNLQQPGTSSPAALPPNAKEQKLIGDVIRITQVVRNLVSNAIKFVPEGGTISVKATWQTKQMSFKEAPHRKKQWHGATEAPSTYTLSSGEKINAQSSGCIQLEVTDTGAGMNEEQLEQLFTPGTQFDANKLQAGGGSGLGLFIAKGIAEQHGGRLVATSKGIGCGSTFTLTLPLVYIPEPHPDALDHESKAVGACSVTDSCSLQDHPKTTEQSTLKILVVDDAPINRKLLIKLLERKGHICDGAVDGQECVDMIVRATEEGWQYDTVLLDYQMPKLSGTDAAKVIRKMGCDSFIVGITGNIIQEDRATFKAAGANGVLLKPFQMPELESLWIEYGIAPETKTAVRTRDVSFEV